MLISPIIPRIGVPKRKTGLQWLAMALLFLGFSQEMCAQVRLQYRVKPEAHSVELYTDKGEYSRTLQPNYYFNVVGRRILAAGPDAGIYMVIINIPGQPSGSKFNIKKGAENGVPSPHLVSSADFGSNFLMKESEFKTDIERIEGLSNVMVGLFVLPVKYRPGNFERVNTDIMSNVSGIVSIGYRIANWTNNMDRLTRPSGLYIGPMIGLFSLDTKTTTIFANGTSSSQTISYPGVSLGLSANVVVANRLTVMAGLGVDQTNTNANWEYNGRPWLGLGVGFTFGIQAEEPENE